MDEHAWLAERFEEHRSRLRAVAYRMLGALAEADEAESSLRAPVVDFIELGAFSKVEPDRAKLIELGLSEGEGSGAQIRTPALLLLAVIPEHPRREIPRSSSNTISRKSFP